VAAGELGLASLPASRPIELEAECVHRFLVLAGLAGATPYVVHVTGRAPLDEIRAARRRGQTAHAEVCPHHLLFDRADHEGPDGLRYVMTPPLREAGDRAALLDGLRTGDVTTYASDHCHLRLDRDKLPVQGDFTKVPTGMPGIGARLPLAFALGGDHPLAVERVVDAACTKPARIFGLERKGAVAPGLDADLVVWDPRAPSRLSLETMNDGLDWTPYDGIEVPGRVRDVLTRGERVVVDGEWAGEEHRGEYLPVGRVRQTA
jgi:dihydropyrimidinase